MERKTARQLRHRQAFPLAVSARRKQPSAAVGNAARETQGQPVDLAADRPPAQDVDGFSRQRRQQIIGWRRAIVAVQQGVELGKRMRRGAGHPL